MARVGIKPKPSLDLFEAIIRYAENKKVADSLKKNIDADNSAIKQEMQNLNLTEFEAGEIKATITTTPNEDFNELQAMEILKTALASEPALLSNIIKTREYIDQDAFEKAVYNHQIDAAILQPAITPKKPTVTLRLGKVKK